MYVCNKTFMEPVSRRFDLLRDLQILKPNFSLDTATIKEITKKYFITPELH